MDPAPITPPLSSLDQIGGASWKLVQPFSHQLCENQRSSIQIDRKLAWNSVSENSEIGLELEECHRYGCLGIPTAQPKRRKLQQVPNGVRFFYSVHFRVFSVGKIYSPNVVRVCCFTGLFIFTIGDWLMTDNDSKLNHGKHKTARYSGHCHRNLPLGSCLVMRGAAKSDGINREIDLKKSWIGATWPHWRRNFLYWLSLF